MHIPDGLIPFPQYLIYYAILFVALFFSLRWTRKNLDERTVPLLAVLAAGIFAIMSMAAPLPPFGISGHMVGAAMIAIIFGAIEPAILIFTLVLLVQALGMGDGGITALGANTLNMGIIGGFIGLYGFKVLKKPLGKIPAIAIASWGAIFLSAIAATLELWLAGTFPLGFGLFFMGLYNGIIGIIEAILTVIVILALESIRPDLLSWTKKDESNDLKSEPSRLSKNRNFFIAGLVIALIIGISAPFIASNNPDGLQKSIEQLNPSVKDTVGYNAPLAGYTIPGFEDNPLGGVIALVLGISVISVIAYITARVLKKRNSPEVSE